MSEVTNPVVHETTATLSPDAETVQARQANESATPDDRSGPTVAAANVDLDPSGNFQPPQQVPFDAQPRQAADFVPTIPPLMSNAAQDDGNRVTSTSDPARTIPDMEAEIQRRVQAALAQQSSAVRTASEEKPTHYVRDAGSDDYYAGNVSPDLVNLFNDGGKRPLFAMQRSVVIDQFGTRANVWFPAPDLELTGPRPGEHRRVYLEEIKGDS